MPDVEQTAPPFRILPKLTDHNRDFWTGGARGELRFWRCQDCGFYIHPPQPLCPMCRSKNMNTEAVSGQATLATLLTRSHAVTTGVVRQTHSDPSSSKDVRHRCRSKTPRML